MDERQHKPLRIFALYERKAKASQNRPTESHKGINDKKHLCNARLLLKLGVEVFLTSLQFKKQDSTAVKRDHEIEK